VISVITIEDAISKTARSLNITQGERVGLSDELLAQAARRAVYIMAPCARHELVGSLSHSFLSEGLSADELSARIDDIVDSLIVYGDVLEMRPTVDGDWFSASRFVLRPAPPTFIARRNGSVVIVGIGGDQITPLTENLEARVSHREALRIIERKENEDLESLLRELGLNKLSEKTWLRVPKSETSTSYISFWKQQLAAEPLCASLEGIRILDTARPPSFYKDRWCVPNQHTGLFVARRPQLYGVEIWCVVELEKGNAKRFKDLSSPGDRFRPVDVAWRIQAALDSVAGTPQRFRCSEEAGNSLIRFYSPLPSWAERHLSIVGRKTKADRCLYSYEISKHDLVSETSFLGEMLWMSEVAE
jgi:hypothetical protein